MKGVSKSNPSNTWDIPMVPGIPVKYQHYANVFNKKKTNTLPSHCSYDYHINIKLGAEIPFGCTYFLSKLEVKTHQSYLKKNLQKEFFCPSTSQQGLHSSS